MGENLRIYIGGLGSCVDEDDLKNRFTSPQLGTVQSVEIIRSKGRSFGYLDFVPVSDKGLAKLFSTYNGCMWKGGRLKLEKAREHYLTRLRHEWEEEAELKVKSSSQNVNADESVHTLQKPVMPQDIEKMQLKIFFPKLHKIKSVPLKGTGKHKYSFQRIEIPPLPIHFCDCEEHSRPSLAERNHTGNHERDDHEADDHETDICGVNVDELNMMKTILDKLLEKDNCSDRVPHRNEFFEEINRDVTSVNESQVEDDEEDEVTNDDDDDDDDDILINVARQPSKRVDVFEEWGRSTTAVNQAREPESFSEPHKLQENENGKLLADKKRKLPIQQNHANNIVPAKRQGGKRVRRGSEDDPVTTCTQPIDAESGFVESSHTVVGSRKSSWRDLVRKKQSSTFHISDILVDDTPEAETKLGSDVAPSSVGKDDGDDQSSKNAELENMPDAQSIKASTSDTKTARGTSWLQKSSWLQLIRDVDSSSFNLAQIFPGVTSEKQELEHHHCNAFIDSRHGEKHEYSDKDRKPLIGGDIREPRETVDEDVHDTHANPNACDSTKELDHVGQDQEHSNPDSKQTVEKKDEASAPMPSIGFIPNARAVGDVMVSETCPFMRNAASMREWTKTKAALSGDHKKKRKGDQ